MAASEDVSKMSSSNISLVDNVFENCVKERLTWDRAMWTERNEENSKLQKLTNSVRYWSVKLAKAQGKNNVIIGLFNASKNVSLSLMEVVDELNAMGIGMKLRGFNTVRNPRYMNFTFDTEETRDYVKKHLRKINGSEVVYLDWALNKGITIVKAHWVPMDFPIEKIIAMLAKQIKVTSYVREEQKLMNGRSLPSGTITFKTELKQDVNIKDIPHLCEVEGLEFLLNVTGRQLMCLNCGLLGHKSNECTTPFCSTCKIKKGKGHECVAFKGGARSFAQVVKSGNEHDVERVIEEKVLNVSEDNKIKLSKEDNERMSYAKKFWSQNKDDNSVLQYEATNAGEWSSVTGKSDATCWDENNVDQNKEDSDYLESDDEESQAIKMKQYIEELQKLKNDSTESANAIKSINNREEGNGLNLSEVEDMDAEVLGLKRKLAGTIKSSVEQVTGSKSKSANFMGSKELRSSSRRGGKGQNFSK